MDTSPCPTEASTSGTAGAAAGLKCKTEVGPTPPQSQRKKAKSTLGSTFKQAEKDYLLGVVLIQENLTKKLTMNQANWIWNEREREIFIHIKQATKRDMPIKPGAYCLATYQ